MKTSFISLFLLTTACFGAKLPATFKKCKKTQSDFKECLSEAAANAIRQMDKPIKEVNLPSLDPLEIPALTIGAGTGPVGLQQNYKNVKIYGFNKPTTTKFDLDLEKKTARLDCVLEEVKIVADYEINGKILLFPVYGKGPATISLLKLHGIEDFKLEEYEKNGRKHLKVVSGKLTLKPGLMKYKFENLFNGDNGLGDNINQVVNESWEEVFNDVKAGYEEAFSQIIVGVFNNLLAKVPISELVE